VLEPTSVWMHRPGRIPDQSGELLLEGGRPLFVGDDGERVRLDGARARRLRGTPVIELRYERDGEQRLALLFFTRPPTNPAFSPGTPQKRMSRSGRIRELTRLRRENRRLKPVVRAWVEAIAG